MIDHRRHAHKHSGRQKVHQQADKARGADGHHLHQTDDQRHHQSGDRVVDERADGQDHVLWLIGEKAADARDAQKNIRRDRQRGQHRHDGEGFDVVC